MISSLRGVVLAASADTVNIEVGGVGYSVAVPNDLAHTARVGEELRVHTALIVREDAMSLFGFSDTDELSVFNLLISVTGVGPKTALGVLSHLSVDQIATAVSHDDDAPFRRVSGIGPKTAKLIVLQLAGKLKPPAPAAAVTGFSPDMLAQLTAALVGLGWSDRVASDAAEQSMTDASDTERRSVALLLRRTLAVLGPPQGGVRA